MRVLYCGLLYSYGDPSKGYSYEHYNLEAGIVNCGLFEVDLFYPDQESLIHGKEHANNRFLSRIQDGNYDIIFHVAFNDSIDLPAQALRFAKLIGTKVIEWDCDASWRFHNFIYHRRDNYTHFITTHSATVPWYNQFGMKVIRSQWGGSPLYLPSSEINSVKKHDVVFVGQKHGDRNVFIKALQGAGINVSLFGDYWDGFDGWNGYGTFEDILQAIQQAKICINLSNPSQMATLPQIKGRHFELPQAGAFQISTPADDLDRYFEFGKEIVIANSPTDLVEKVKYYLDNPEERNAIARAGHERMKKEHQWSHRFNEIIDSL